MTIRLTGSLAIGELPDFGRARLELHRHRRSSMRRLTKCGQFISAMGVRRVWGRHVIYFANNGSFFKTDFPLLADQPERLIRIVREIFWFRLRGLGRL